MEVRLKGRNPRSPGGDNQSVDQKDYGHAHAYLVEVALLHQSDSIRSGPLTVFLRRTSTSQRPSGNTELAVIASGRAVICLDQIIDLVR